MAKNKNKIQEHYQDALREDGRFSRDISSSMESYYTKKFIVDYISSTSSVIEVGCGTGFYGMFLADKCDSYLGIDITTGNIELFNKKIKANKLKNVQAQVGDATKLDSIPGNRFDVVLILGPMYHLPPEERELVFKESKRICKDGGIIIYAYINKVGAYLAGCFMAPEIYPSDKVGKLVLDNGNDDLRPDIFFLTTPEEIEKVAAKEGLIVIKNVGTDFTIAMNIINNMSKKQLKAWYKLNNFMSNSPSCTGVSNHALLICKNVSPGKINNQ